MSVLDSLTSELFEEMLGHLDRARTYRRVAQSDESIIEQINRIAEELLPREEPPPLGLFDESMVHFDAGVGTNESSFLEVAIPRASQIRSADNPLEYSKSALKRTTLTSKGATRKDLTTPTASGKLTSKQSTAAKTILSAHCERLHEDAKQRHNQKANAFVLSEINLKVKESSLKESLTTSRKESKKENNLVRINDESRVSDIKGERIKKLVKEQQDRKQYSLERQTTEITLRNHSLEALPRSSIYERTQLKLATRQQFIVAKRQEKQLKEVAELKPPLVNNSLRVEGSFQERLVLTTEKSKINKALIARKELNRISYQPKLTSGGWKVESKVKALWTKKTKTDQYSPVVREQKQDSKSLNSTAMDSMKFSTIGKPKPAEDSKQHTTIEIKFANDLDFLLN